jgi:hypothetical protein
MTETSASAGNPDTAAYEIRVTGHLDHRWAAWFDGLTLTHDNDGTTLLRGCVADQAALHGLLQRMRDLGLPLVSVVQVHPEQPPPISQRTGNQRRRST